MIGGIDTMDQLTKKVLNDNTATNAISSLQAAAVNNMVTPYVSIGNINYNAHLLLPFRIQFGRKSKPSKILELSRATATAPSSRVCGQSPIRLHTLLTPPSRQSWISFQC